MCKLMGGQGMIGGTNTNLLNDGTPLVIMCNCNLSFGMLNNKETKKPDEMDKSQLAQRWLRNNVAKCYARQREDGHLCLRTDDMAGIKDINWLVG
jgi:hypothetical protein